MKYINILIIDRDKSNIYETKKHFKNNVNTRIFQAQNMRESLKIVIKNQIDLIIYDFQMPYFNSFEIAKILQKNSINTKVSFVFVGYLFEKELSKANNIEYVSKPINSFNLQSKINKYIELVI